MVIKLYNKNIQIINGKKFEELKIAANNKKRS